MAQLPDRISRLREPAGDVLSATMNSDVPADAIELERAVVRERVKSRLLGEENAGIPLGRFRLLRLLGRGTTGVVYEALDTQAQVLVSLKLLRTSGVKEVARFKREFRSLTHIVHDNLVQLYELFAHGDQWYFTMELVRGTDFVTYVRGANSGDHCDQDKLLSALVQLLCAVQAIHDAGKLHCDLKPSNVLVDHGDRLMVLDYGLLRPNLAIFGGVEDVPQSLRGTPAYMAPELRPRVAPTEASDMYSVGVMLFQALTGELPSDSMENGRPVWPFEGTASVRGLDRAVAQDLVDVCSALLDRVPSRRPTVARVLRLLHANRNGTRARSVSGPVVPLIGRERELEQLHAAFAALQPGKPAFALVRGPSGIGKSALIDQFAVELNGRAIVLRARCYERESLPYKAFDGIVDGLRRHLLDLPVEQRARLAAAESAALLRIFPSLHASFVVRSQADAAELPVDVHEQRQRAFGALKSLLRQSTEHKPLVVIVDDLQWADRDSARLLVELFGPPEAPALLYLGACRGDADDSSEFLQVLAGDPQWPSDNTSVMLSALAPDRAAELARALLCDAANRTANTAAAIAREAQGIPFFIAELSSYAADALHDHGTALSLSELLSRRVFGLPDTEQRVLSLLSVAGRPVAPHVLMHAFRDTTTFQRALRVLTLQGLVHGDGSGRLFVYHDQLRELLAHRLIPGFATELHRTLAQAYERDSQVEPQWLIAHWCGALEPAKALRYARSAAEAAMSKLAFNRAADIYHIALELEADASERRRLHAARADALVNAGHGAPAALALLNAVDPADAAGSRALRGRAAQQYLRTGNKREATELLDPLFREVGSRYPHRTLHVALRLVANWLRLTLPLLPPRNVESARERLVVLGSVFMEGVLQDPLRCVLFQREYYQNALCAGDTTAIFRGFAWDIYNRAAIGGWRLRHDTSARIARLETMAGELGTEYARATVLLIRAATGLLLGDWKHAGSYAEQAGELFREHCPGTHWERAVSDLVHGLIIENVGPIHVHRDRSARALRHAQERGDQFTDAMESVSFGCWLLAQDKAVEARAFLDRRLARLTGDVDAQFMGILSRTIDCMFYTRDAHAAWSTTRRYWPEVRRGGYHRMELLGGFYRVRMARAALLLYLDRGDAVLHRDVEVQINALQRTVRPDLRLAATTLRAALAFQCGDLASARQLLRAAVEQSDEIGTTVASHCFRLRLGGVTPGVEGQRLVAQASAALRDQGVVNPDRWAEIYVTGFVA